MNNLPVPAKAVPHPVLGFIGWLLLCYTPALTAAFISMGDWFYLLHKPAWNPPNWLFGPVWMTLYTLMAISAWLVWCQGGWVKQMRPLTLFVIQLVLNALWTPLFFGLHLPALAFFEMLLLWVTLLATIGSFWKVHRWAAILLIPYITWVSFAAFLNFTIWRLNV
jgi:tryptophan-rich sensory protein